MKTRDLTKKHGTERRRLGTTFSLGCLLCTSAWALADDASEASRAFGPPPGTRSVYAATSSTLRGTEPSPQEFTATVYRGPGDSSRDVAAIFDQKLGTDDVFVAPLPLVLVRVGRDGALEGDRRGEIPEPRSYLLGSIFFALRGSEIRPGSRWTREELLPIAYLPAEIAVETDVEEGGEGKLRLRSRTIAEKRLSDFGFAMILRSWNREAVVDAASGRTLEVKLELRIASESGGEAPSESGVDLRLVETEHRALTAEEAASLPDEIRRLRDVEASMDGGPTPLEAIFGVRRKPSADPLALLAEYEKEHPKGVLAAGVPALRETLRRRAEAERREKEAEAKAARLIGAPAPDFKLEDLGGKPVSLSDFRGKVVLLAFWGYG